MKRISISIVITTLVIILSGCYPDASDRHYDEVAARVSGWHDKTEAANGGCDESSASSDSTLSGVLTVLLFPWDHHLQMLADLFMKEHPGVKVDFQFIAYPLDISKQVALTTKLYADPPDIFNVAGLAFEKFSVDDLFVDMNQLLDGPNGINRADYFDQILRGAEMNGRLYYVPMMVVLEMVMLNKRYVESIGAPLSDMRSITVSEYLDMYVTTAAISPEDNLLVSFRFNANTLLRFMPLYDAEAGTVNADTPEMIELLELIKSIPVAPHVEYTPDNGVRYNRSFELRAGPNSVIDDGFFRPAENYLYIDVYDLSFPFQFFFQEDPRMLFSHPMHRKGNDGDILFGSVVGPGIMRSSRNQELAWEFVRFCMEYPSSLFKPFDKYDYEQSWSFPVNRSMFDDHLRLILNESYRTVSRLGELQITLGGDAEEDALTRHRQVEYSLFRFRELMEMANTESRINTAIFYSLVYPDIYLFVNDRQNAERTLMNIHNNLKIYISE